MAPLRPSSEARVNTRYLIANLAAVLAATCVVPGTGRAAEALTATGPVQSGFLADYGRLENKGFPGDPFSIYTDPAFGATAVKAVYAVPAAPYPSDTKFVDVDPAVITGALAALDAELRKRVSAKWRLAPSAAAADVVLQVVLTQVVAEAQGLKPRDFIPARAVTLKALQPAIEDSARLVAEHVLPAT